MPRHRRPPPSVDAAVAQAKSLIAKGKAEEALAILRVLPREEPHPTEILFQTGLAAIAAADRGNLSEDEVLNRGFTLAGFSPQLVLANEVRRTNAQALDYKRNRNRAGSVSSSSSEPPAGPFHAGHRGGNNQCCDLGPRASRPR